MRLPLWPFAYGFGLGAGAVLAIVLGVYGPSWGVAAAFPAVTLLFALGALFEDDAEHICHLLRFAVAATLGFVMVTVPINLVHLTTLVAQAPDALAPIVSAQAAELRTELWPRWGVITLALPVGAIAIAVRIARRAKRAAEPSR